MCVSLEGKIIGCDAAAILLWSLLEAADVHIKRGTNPTIDK